MHIAVVGAGSGTWGTQDRSKKQRPPVLLNWWALVVLEASYEALGASTWKVISVTLKRSITIAFPSVIGM